MINGDPTSSPIPNTLEGLRDAFAVLRADFDSHDHSGSNSRAFRTMKAETLSSRAISMRKTSYTDSAAGMWAGLVNSVVKLNLGNATSYLKWDGANISIAGALTASSIDIPDTVTASSFHVDAQGNTWWGATAFASGVASISKDGAARVKSLERSDFHWFTIFESIDGYAKAGAGTQTLNQDSVTLATTSSNASESELQKIATYSSSFTYDKRRKIKFGVVFDFNTLQYIDMMSGPVGYGVNQAHFGFRVLNGTLSGVTDTGAGETVTSLVGTVATNTVYELEARLNPGVSVEFYVNGTLVATNTTSVPTGTGNAQYLLDFYIRALSASVRSFKFTYYDFWQAN